MPLETSSQHAGYALSTHLTLNAPCSYENVLLPLSLGGQLCENLALAFVDICTYQVDSGGQASLQRIYRTRISGQFGSLVCICLCTRFELITV